jgi:hypothetical protein
MFLVYNVNGLPKGMTMETWYQLYLMFNIIFYDSAVLPEGEKPFYLSEDGIVENPEHAFILNLANEHELEKAKIMTKMTFDQYEIKDKE